MALETNQGKHCHLREVCTKREREREWRQIDTTSSRGRSFLERRRPVQKFNPSLRANAPLVTVNYYPDTRCSSRRGRRCSQIPSLFDCAVARASLRDGGLKYSRSDTGKRSSSGSGTRIIPISRSAIGREGFPQGNRPGRASAGSGPRKSNSRIGGMQRTD